MGSATWGQVRCGPLPIRVAALYPPPPLKSPPFCRAGSPPKEGGRSQSDGSPGGGGGHHKWREESCFAVRGWHGDPFAQPPSPSLVAVPGGGFGLGLPYLPCPGGGGGPTPTYIAQNDPHVALIILTTRMWGKFFRDKKISGPKFVFRRLWWQHPSKHKTKGLARKPISGTPPPPLLRRAPMPSPPPPPRKAIFGPPICTIVSQCKSASAPCKNCPLVPLAPSIFYAFWAKVTVPPLEGGGGFQKAGGGGGG